MAKVAAFSGAAGKLRRLRGPSEADDMDSDLRRVEETSGTASERSLRTSRAEPGPGFVDLPCFCLGGGASSRTCAAAGLVLPNFAFGDFAATTSGFC